ncbi:MAG: tRNA (adenosine(37)-N6)-threonylcarbamoyltransferase complex dimerization subunit type 1 TsaB [Bdellovibrionaceae bacterium]|nr:tRNA (adenosine(37)-N6)-threonylcarbamoyltransferase complex dimerization subunit type 1 TsaB [Pseudobdellovibrionaceae bacterium]
MIVLALESSTQLGGVSIIKDGQVIASESSMRQQSHSEYLNAFVATCLERAGISLNDVDIFAVGQGPGSFTGIRVASNIGKSFSYIYKKPMVAIDSLVLLAAPVKTKLPVVSIINAYKNMVYFSCFDLSKGLEPTRQSGPIAIPVKDLSEYVSRDVLVIGDGFETYQEFFPNELKDKLIRDSQYSDYPKPETLGLIAEIRARHGQTIEWNSFTPLYIRASEAEENKRGVLISPLK